MSNNVYQIVTDRIIDQLQQGIIPWNKPWVGYSRQGGSIRISALAVSHVTGKPYSMINQLMLGRAGEYLTFKQCQAEGGSIRKGAKQQIVCFWKQLPVDAVDEQGNVILDDNGKPVKKLIPFLRYYGVFHIDDCIGIKAKWDKVTQPQTIKIPADHADAIPEADDLLNSYINREGIKLVADKVSDEAYYSPALDLINLPCIRQFKYAAEYYSTAFHEATHSTGHSKRLDRFSKQVSHRFGSQDYSKEELVAEIGAASICHSLGIATDNSFRNSVAYIQSWLKSLRNDPKMVVSAASKAEKAVAYIYGDIETADAEGEQG
jgi:antirestriction protein ArdC